MQRRDAGLTQREMLTRFAQMGVPEYAFWLGPVNKAEMVNGLILDGNRWMVYYRERGRLSSVVHFDTQEEACDELYARIIRNIQSYKKAQTKGE